MENEDLPGLFIIAGPKTNVESPPNSLLSDFLKHRCDTALFFSIFSISL